MYYLIFSYYKDYKRTVKGKDFVFETNDSFTAFEILKFFSYIENQQYVFSNLNDDYRKLTSIFYADIRDSFKIQEQFHELHTLLKNPTITPYTKNEVNRFKKFFQSILRSLSLPDKYHATLELISVSDIFSID